MSWLIEKTARSLSALALAALLGASSCSPSDPSIAKITLDANAPEVTPPPCVPQIREARDVGLDLYFVVDHSWGMWLNPLYWNAVFLGLGGIFDLPEFKGMDAGFAMYPPPEPIQGCSDACGAAPTCDCLNDCRCDQSHYDPRAGFCRCDQWQTSCDEADYVPTFEIEPLTGEGRHRQALIRIPAPAGLPALNQALLGSLRYRNGWERVNPRRRITQVLIAASPFAVCTNNGILDSEKVLRGSDKPKTYVVTVDEDDSDYDRLAIAGRTEAAIRLEVNPRLPAPSLSDALIKVVQEIRVTDGRCEYPLPPEMPDLDAKKVNLTATRDGASFQYVGNASGCALAPQGWYYDDPDHPTRILTCEGTCKTLHETSPTPSTAFIQLGCPTMDNASR
jgi:hypothetical protein